MERKYRYDEFLEEVRFQVEQVLPQYRVTIESGIKTNDVVLRGIQIKREGEPVGLCMYLENWYERYLDGMKLGSIVEEIVRKLPAEMEREVLDTSLLLDYEQVRSHICYSLINPAYNVKILEERPHTPFLDLEKVYEVDAGFLLADTQPARVAIRYGMLETWGVTEEEIRKEAEKNTPQIRKPSLASMESVLLEMKDPELPELPEFHGPEMYVLTNEQSWNGAAVLAYPGITEWIADTLKTDFYVLPSSVHETILLTAAGPSINEKELSAMIQEVNITNVRKDEWLGDHPYKYDKTLGILMPVGVGMEKKEEKGLGARTEKRQNR